MDSVGRASSSPPPSPPTHDNRTRFIASIAWLLSLAVCLGCVASSSILLSNDGPQAAFTTFADAHLDDPALIYQHQFLPGLGLTGHGFSAIYSPLLSLVSSRTALMLFQGLLIVLLALGGAVVARFRRHALDPTVLASLTLPFAWPMYMGFYAYCVGTAIGLWTLAYLLHHATLNLIPRVVLFLLLLVQVLAHPMAALVTLVLVLLILTARQLPKGAPALRSELPWMALYASPTILVFAALATAKSSLSQVAYSQATEWLPMREWLMTIPRIVVPGSTFLGWFVLVLSIAGATIGAFHARRSGNADERALAVGTLGLFAFSILGPMHLSGWQFFAPRFLWLPVCLGLSAWRIPLGQSGILLGIAASLTSLWVAWNGKSTEAMLQSACSDAIAGLEHQVPRTRFQLPIILDQHCGLADFSEDAAVPHLSPMLHFGAFFAERHGGTTPFVFTGAPIAHMLTARPNSLVPIPPLSIWGLPRSSPEMTQPASRRDIIDQNLVFGMRYENILVFGATKVDLAQLDERGYVQDFAQGTFYNGHFEGCSVDLVFSPLPSDRSMAVIAGFGENALWRAAFSKEGDRIHALAKTLCGDIWVQAQWLESKATCRDADTNGRIHVSATRGKPVIVDCVR